MKASADDNARFETFWVWYPKKRGKPDALKAWAKLKPDDALLDVMLGALDRWRRSADWTRENGRYIPYPATWLNGRRWEDEPDTPVSGARWRPTEVAL